MHDFEKSLIILTLETARQKQIGDKTYSVLYFLNVPNTSPNSLQGSDEDEDIYLCTIFTAIHLQEKKNRNNLKVPRKEILNNYSNSI